MSTPFLSVYTPTYQRPTFLEENRRSIQDQTISRELEHIIIEDTVGLGVGGMFQDIRKHAGKTRGEYVLVLSDDNALYDSMVADDLFDFINESGLPDVVIWRGDLRGHHMPTAAVWRQRPILGHIDLSNFIVHGSIWRNSASQWLNDYAGDFHFINYLYNSGHSFAWFERFGYRALAVMKGATEEEWNDAGRPAIMSEDWREKADRRRQLSRHSG